MIEVTDGAYEDWPANLFVKALLETDHPLIANELVGAGQPLGYFREYENGRCH